MVSETVADDDLKAAEEYAAHLRARRDSLLAALTEVEAELTDAEGSLDMLRKLDGWAKKWRAGMDAKLELGLPSKDLVNATILQSAKRVLWDWRDRHSVHYMMIADEAARRGYKPQEGTKLDQFYDSFRLCMLQHPETFEKVVHGRQGAPGYYRLKASVASANGSHKRKVGKRPSKSFDILGAYLLENGPSRRKDILDHTGINGATLHRVTKDNPAFARKGVLYDLSDEGRQMFKQ